MQPIPSEHFHAVHVYYQSYIMLAFALGLLLSAVHLLNRRGYTVHLSLPVIILIAALIRLPMLLFADFWFDESFTSTVVSGSWRHFWLMVVSDVHPPVYYFIVKVLHDAIPVPQMMRIPAYISGLALVWVWYHIGKHWYGSDVGRWAALLIALMPATIYYSTEARYPMMLALLASGSYLAILKERWRTAAVLAALVSTMHVTAWFYAGLLTYIIILNSKWRLSWLTSLLIACWLPTALVQAKDVADGFWIIQSFPFRHIVDMTITTRGDVPVWLTFVIISVWLSLVLAALIAWRSHTRPAWLALVILPPLAEWFVGVVWHPIYLERTLMFSALLLILPLAWWLEHRANAVSVSLLFATLALSSGILIASDRTKADDAIAACEGSAVIYAPDTFSAVLATHHSDALIMSNVDGNTRAQYISTPARSSMWILGSPETINDGTCVFLQQGALGYPELYEHIVTISEGLPVIESHDYFVARATQ